MNKFYFVFIIILIWGFNPLLKKKASQNMGTNEYMLINHLLITGFFALYSGFLFYNKKYNIKSIKNINKECMLFCILGALATALSTIMFVNIIKNYNISDIMPYIQAAVIILIGVTGYIFLKEKFNKYKIIGYIFIIIGIIVANYRHQ